MAYILEKIGNTYNLPKKYFTCDAKSDLDGISLVDVPIGSEAYCILEEESYILDSNKQWHKKKISEDLTGQVQANLSQTNSAQADYVKGIIRPESLPEGYPYKEVGKGAVVLAEKTLTMPMVNPILLFGMVYLSMCCYHH